MKKTLIALAVGLMLSSCTIKNPEVLSVAAVASMTVLKVDRPDVHEKVCYALVNQAPSLDTLDSVLDKVELTESGRVAAKAALAVLAAEAKLVAEPTQGLKDIIARVCP